MIRCRFCDQELAEESRFCIRCGRAVSEEARTAWDPKPRMPEEDRDAEEMNVMILYVMVAALIVAVLFPPWETPPGHPPRFLGFHFILNPPAIGVDGQSAGVISRLLITIELVTIAVAGLYFSWLFRKKAGSS